MTPQTKTMATAGAPAKADGAPLHIVDELIEERCARLRARPLWPLWRSILYPLLLYREARKMADALAPMGGREALDYMSALLHLDTEVSGADHIPKTGPVIIAATHPTGIADGIAVYDAIRPVREDMIFFANRDAIRVNPRLEEVLIPVEWVEAKRNREKSRETLVSTVNAFTQGKCVVLFPSGRIARMDDEKVQHEQPWLASVAIFAKKYKCPVVPAKVTARNSWMYYWFWKINTELRDITLFHELLNKRGKRFGVAFGPAIPHDALPADNNEAAAALQHHASEDVPAGRTWRGPARA